MSGRLILLFYKKSKGEPSLYLGCVIKAALCIPLGWRGGGPRDRGILGLEQNCTPKSHGKQETALELSFSDGNKVGN